MGKGRIITALGEGRYTLEILEDRARAESARTLAQSRLADLDTRISDLEDARAQEQDAVDAAADALDQAIDAYQAEMRADGESSIDTATPAAELQQAAAKRDAIAGHIRAVKAQRLAAQARIDRINDLPPLRQIEAWCADYTEDLSGEVATAEVPGEIGQVVIKPGFDNGAAWSPSTDGAMQPTLSGTPASVFYNLAMLPGWQKWRPTFRIATVSNIDSDLCDITLEAATSSQQGLNVNAQASYAGVPIMYMDCNGDAFEDGDRALVAFSGNTGMPVVVGFEQEPKECCNCEPTVLGTSPSSGMWEVLEDFGDTAVEACPSDEWRIYDTTQEETAFSGQLREEEGILYMDGLPEEVVGQESETVVDGASHCNPPEEIQETYNIPAPAEKFWGGRWSSGYLGGGSITDQGEVMTSWGENLVGSYLVIWTVDDCFKFTMTYSKDGSEYELQLGCKQRDGSIEWPDG